MNGNRFDAVGRNREDMIRSSCRKCYRIQRGGVELDRSRLKGRAAASLERAFLCGPFLNQKSAFFIGGGALKRNELVWSQDKFGKLFFVGVGLAFLNVDPHGQIGDRDRDSVRAMGKGTLKTACHPFSRIAFLQVGVGDVNAEALLQGMLQQLPNAIFLPLDILVFDP